MNSSEIRQTARTASPYLPAAMRLRERAMPAGRIGQAPDVWGKILPDGLSLAHHFGFLTEDERRFVNRIQGRTYANLHEFFSRTLKIDLLRENRGQWRSGPVTRRLQQRFAVAERATEQPFRRIEEIVSRTMPRGYRFVPCTDTMAEFAAPKPRWAMLAFTLYSELATREHYDACIADDADIAPLYKRAFQTHRSGASLNAVIGEMEWTLHDVRLMAQERDAGVKAFIEILEATDRVLRAQARADMRYFAMNCDRPVGKGTLSAVEDGLLKAYRWQFIFSGMRNPRYTEVSRGLMTEAHRALIGRTLASFDPRL